MIMMMSHCLPTPDHISSKGNHVIAHHKYFLGIWVTANRLDKKPTSPIKTTKPNLININLNKKNKNKIDNHLAAIRKQKKIKGGSVSFMPL